jgi:hypothetical protein
MHGRGGSNLCLTKTLHAVVTHCYLSLSLWDTNTQQHSAALRIVRFLKMYYEMGNGNRLRVRRFGDWALDPGRERPNCPFRNSSSEVCTLYTKIKRFTVQTVKTHTESETHTV